MSSIIGHTTYPEDPVDSGDEVGVTPTFPARHDFRSPPQSQVRHAVVNPSGSPPRATSSLGSVTPRNTLTPRRSGDRGTKPTIDFSIEEDTDILAFVDGAISRARAAAILETAVVKYGGFTPNSREASLARGALLKWLAINSASGRHDYSNIVPVGQSGDEIAVACIRDGLRDHNVDELRRLNVALLPELDKLVRSDRATREHIARMNGVRDVGKAYLALDSYWKLPGISTDDAAQSRQLAKGRINRSNLERELAPTVSSDSNMALRSESER